MGAASLAACGFARCGSLAERVAWGHHRRVAPEESEPQADTRRRWAVVFGWIAGGAAGVLANTALEVLLGATWPEAIGIFVLFVLGAFGGMHLAKKLGPRGFRILGVASGVLVAATALVLFVTFVR